MRPRMDVVSETTDKGMDFDFNMGGKSRELRTMSNQEMAKLVTGQSGATLDEVVHHGTGKYGQYGLIDDTFLDDLRRDHTKIKDLMARLGETREAVSIVAHTADGGFTRMLLKKDVDGKYKEVKEDVNSSDKEKTHRQDNDLFIFEKGVKAIAA